MWWQRNAPPAVHELALGCAPKTPLFLAVRLLNRKKEIARKRAIPPASCSQKGRSADHQYLPAPELSPHKLLFSYSFLKTPREHYIGKTTGVPLVATWAVRASEPCRATRSSVRLRARGAEPAGGGGGEQGAGLRARARGARAGRVGGRRPGAQTM